MVVFPRSESAVFQLIDSRDKRDLLGGICRELTGSDPKVELRLEDNGSTDEAKEDPVEDPRVQSFLKEFPGKVQINRKMES